MKLPPILYFSPSLGERLDKAGEDGLHGLIDATVPTVPLAWSDDHGGWMSIPDLPADAVWLSGGEVATEWAIRWPEATIHSDQVGIEPRATLADARAVAALYRSHGPEVVSRTVTRSPWTAAEVTA